MATRLVIEWTRNSLRLAVSEGSGPRRRLRACRVEPLASGQDTGQLVRTVLKTLKVSGDIQVIGVIPREQVISRVIKFPTVASAELAQMVELYGKAQLPYAKEQAIVDFTLLEQRDGFSTVAVMACQRETLDRYLAPLRAAGLSIECVTISSCGVMGWYRAATRTVRLPEPVLIVNHDEERTDVVLVREGQLLLSRSITLGSLDQHPDGGFEMLAHELEQSLSALRKELPGVEVHALLLTGVGPIASWKERASQHFNLPVTVIDGAQPLGSGAAMRSASTSPVVVGGTACVEVRHLLNLSPPEIRQLLHHRLQVRHLSLVGVLLFGVLVLGAGLAALHVYREGRLVQQLDGTLSRVEPMTRQLNVKSQAAQLVTGILEHRRRLAVLLGVIFHVTPANIVFEGLTFERAKSELVLRGHAPSTQHVLTYVQALKQLEGIADVQLKYATGRKTPAGEQTDFELLIQQEPR